MYDPQTGVHTFVKTIANAETLGILLAFVFRQAIFKFFPLQFFVVFFSPFFPRPFFPVLFSLVISRFPPDFPKATLDTTNMAKRTPLHLACDGNKINSHEQTIVMLIDVHGANALMRDRSITITIILTKTCHNLTHASPEPPTYLLSLSPAGTICCRWICCG